MRRSMNLSLATRAVLICGVLSIVVLGWKLSSLLDLRLFLPESSPELAASALAIRTQILLLHGWITAYETVIGFISALAGGLLGAILLRLSPSLASAMWPSILFAQIIPKVAIAPFLLVWLGFGPLPKVIIAFLIAFFPILANAYAGLQSIDSETEELARSMHANGFHYFLNFELPHALPRIFSGARIAITFAVVGAVVAEFVGSDAGLGYLVILAARTLNSGLMLSSIIALALLGIGLYELVAFAERLLIPWHISQRRAAMRELSETRAAAGGL